MPAMNFKLPPSYITVPVELVYSTIPAAIKDTYMQLRGLAWKTKYRETPPLTFAELAEILQKSVPTVYEHLRFLRERSWLLFRSAGESVYIFSFTVPAGGQEDQASKAPSVSENSETPFSLLNNLYESIPDSEKEKRGILKNQKRQPTKPAEEGKTPDPNLSHPAVIAFHQVINRWPNKVQRASIAARVVDVVLWRAAVAHWIEHGWRPTNVTGMLDSYDRGGRLACAMCTGGDSKTGGAKPGRKATPQDIDDVFARIFDGES